MSTPMPLRRFLEEVWLPAIEPTVRATTFVNYRSHVLHQIGSRLGELSLVELDGPKLNLFYAQLAASGRVDGKGGLRPASVRRIHATLHRALRDAVRWGYLSDNPADRCDPPKARWMDVDLDRAQLSVRQTLVPVGGRVLFSQPKTARGRRVLALDAVTVAALRDLRQQSRRDGDELVFVDKTGQHLNPSEISRRFRELVAQSGLPRIRLHDLRHTHATLALEAGIHPKIVSERLGHATVSLTLDVYSHAVGHMQAEAADQIARLVFIG